nr:MULTISPECIES: GTP cyclohydrolase I FolE [unclassified Candidatus Frackibacter]
MKYYKKIIAEGELIMVDRDKIREAVEMILEAIGEDPKREGLQETPDRVARMYEEVFSGLHKDPSDDLQIFFTEEHEELVLVKDISFYSMCEHHLLPFYGKAHVGYIPKSGKVTGLSKLARVVDSFAKRPQLQERLTSQVADLIMDNIDARGVIVVIEAEHMCMTMRGIKKPGSFTTTSAVRGILHKDQAVRAEALKLIKD